MGRTQCRAFVGEEENAEVVMSMKGLCLPAYVYDPALKRWIVRRGDDGFEKKVEGGNKRCRIEQK